MITIGWLGVGYLAVGVIALLVIGVVRERPSLSEAVLITALWPIWIPLHLADRGQFGPEHELVRAIGRAHASPLAGILPDPALVRTLAARLREADGRMHELDRVLARPDFAVDDVRMRHAALVASGAQAAAATVELRLRTLAQLARLRERYRNELDEIRELIAQLTAQAELVRLQPTATHASRELVHELVARVEGLAEMEHVE